MSSENDGEKPDAPELAPTSGTLPRQSSRAASLWGPTRNALAAVHNLDALLRSVSVLYRTIVDLLPELRASSAVLLATFERARAREVAADPAQREVGDYGVDRADELVRLLDDTAKAYEERDALADRARALADELEATADLLALLDRAEDPGSTDVTADRLVREAVRLSGSGRGREVVVRFVEPNPDCVLYADPYVVAPLLSLLVTAVRAGGVVDLVVRARCESGEATFLVEEATPADASHPTLAIRILPTVPPCGAVARRVAAQIGATLELGPRRGALRIPRAPG